MLLGNYFVELGIVEGIYFLRFPGIEFSKELESICLGGDDSGRETEECFNIEH